jgi:hypothetical protein
VFWIFCTLTLLARKISDFDTLYLSVKTLNSDDDDDDNDDNNNNNNFIEKRSTYI